MTKRKSLTSQLTLTSVLLEALHSPAGLIVKASDPRKYAGRCQKFLHRNPRFRVLRFVLKPGEVWIVKKAEPYDDPVERLNETL